MSKKLRCRVAGCPNVRGRDPVFFYYFPMNPLRRDKWMEACGLVTASEATHSNVVCATHFSTIQFKPNIPAGKKPQLRLDAVPDLKLGDPNCVDVEDVLKLTKNCCRLCMCLVTNKDKDAQDLFKPKSGQPKLSSELQLYFQLQFEESPLWPSLVCGKCVRFIGQMKVFKGNIMSTHCTLFRRIPAPTPVTASGKKKNIEPTWARDVQRKRRTLEDKKRLVEHMSVLGALRCDICQASFYELNDLINHQTIEHALSSGHIFCCNKRLKMGERALDHVELHMNPNAFQCPTCDKRFKSFHLLTCHEIKEHRARKFQCSMCEKRFMNRRHLVNHEAIHLPVEQRPWQCSYCGKGFSTKEAVRRHIDRVHELADRYQCEICGRFFSEKGSMTEHKKSHEPGYREMVKKINRVRMAKKKEVAGTTTRKKVGPRCAAVHETMVCLLCNLTTRNMRWHMLDKHPRDYVPTEAEQVLIECSDCGKSIETYKMEKHKKRHAKKPKTCGVCGLAFSSQSTYYSHMARHQEKTYPCQLCPVVANSLWSRYSHFRTVHPEEFKMQYKGKKSLD